MADRKTSRSAPVAREPAPRTTSKTTASKAGSRTTSKAATRNTGDRFAAQVAALRAQVQALSKQVEMLGLTALTDEDRLHSNGRLREGEADAMASILGTIDVHPAIFEALAARDHGSDDAVVETGPAREALARSVALAPLVRELSTLLTRVSDGVLASASLAKEVTGPAYAIIRANESMMPKIRQSAAVALNFHGVGRPKAPRGGKKAVKTPV